MAANLTDDELRSRLSSILGSSKNIPPIVDATRPLLMEKLSRLQCHGEFETISDDAKCLSVPKAIFSPLKLLNIDPQKQDTTPLQPRNESRIFQSLVFFDIEATGLPSGTRPPRITELCLKALNAEHFISLKPLLEMYKESKHFEDILPRVSNTLTLCFNPGALIPDHVTDITGLNNDLLENQNRFNSQTVKLLKSFLENLPQPMCLIAHNGARYDYPLLQAELVNTGLQNLIDDIYIIDSLTALKEIFNQQGQDDLYEDSLIFKHGRFDTENMPLMDEEITSAEVKKPRLRDEDELNLFKTTPEKSLDTILENDNPPPTGHSLNRRRTSELLSSDRRKNGAKVKKKLSFDQPHSFSLPLLHEHIFGIKPRSSHGAEIVSKTFTTSISKL